MAAEILNGVLPPHFQLGNVRLDIKDSN